MVIIITEWALQSYLELRSRNVFSDQDYWNVIRPDVERLRTYPLDQKFGIAKFWGLATDRTGVPLVGGFKMKWHNLGPGQVQLRLAVALVNGEALLCRGYVKSDPKVDKAEMAKFKDHLRRISLGTYTRRGTL
jgi:hypothetical protein